MNEIVFSAALLLIVTGRLVQYAWLYAPFIFRIPVLPENENKEPVSLIMTAKNEEENLRENIPRWLAQDHHEFEIIVVDDQSEDDSLLYLKEAQKQDSRLKIVELGQHIHKYPGKKLALLLAMKKAAHDCLLFTDADCRPAGEKCLRYMSRGFSEGKQIVIGFAPTGKKGRQSGFFSWETMLTGMQYLSMAYKGAPYMGVGRNMGYRKSFFLEKKGFTGNLSLAQGDDDLFVAAHATKENVALVVHPDAYVYSENKSSLNDWLYQKRRHLATGVHYPSKVKMSLGLLWLAGLLFYLSPLLLLVSGKLWIYGLAAWGIVFLVQAVVWSVAFKKLTGNIGAGWITHFFFDLIYHCLYYPFMGLILWWKGNSKTQWK